MRIIRSPQMFGFFLGLALIALSSCQSPATVQQTVTAIVTPTPYSQKFASGTKAVKIITNQLATGSFAVPTLSPSVTPVPSPYPGYTGSATYLPGASAATYYDVDGVSVITKPSWLYDVQLGLTSGASGAQCAGFGTSGTYDVADYYRTSEHDCGSEVTGTGSNLDPAFIRIVLNRDNTYLGSAENLVIQMEYQAAAVRLNSDGISTSPEDNVDQLWKIFWNTSLASTAVANVFSVFVPPNYSSCVRSGTYHSPDAPAGANDNCALIGSTYSGAPITVKQFIIPLSAYPTMSVIQFSRVKGRINATGFLDSPANTKPVNYLNDYCTSSKSPLCAGIVFRSIMLMRH